MRKNRFQSPDHAFLHWLVLPVVGLLLLGLSILLDAAGGTAASGWLCNLLGVGSLAAFLLAVFVLFPGWRQ